jgi:uncharacterized protein YqgQ
MKSIYDVQQFLKRFGTIIYIGDRVGDLELMKAEIEELYKSQLMEKQEFDSALLLLIQEIQRLKEERDR